MRLAVFSVHSNKVAYQGLRGDLAAILCVEGKLICGLFFAAERRSVTETAAWIVFDLQKAAELTDCCTTAERSYSNQVLY